MLANTLQAVISQTLFKRADQPGMIPAVEIMLCTPAVRNCIRENRIFEIPNVIETSRALGMQTLDSSIKQLYVNGYISREDAIAQAAHPEKLERALGGLEGELPATESDRRVIVLKLRPTRCLCRLIATKPRTSARQGHQRRARRRPTSPPPRSRSAHRGEYILALAPADADAKTRSGFNLSLSFGPSAKDVQNFTSQLAVMIRAGISIRAAIEGIADQVENPKFKEMLVQMKKDVEAGKQFSDALMRYPKIFSPALHQHGEGVGTVRRLLQDARPHRRLPRAADRDACRWSWRDDLSRHHRHHGRSARPIFLLTFVLPRFMVIFKGKEAALPVPDQVAAGPVELHGELLVRPARRGLLAASGASS